MRKKKVAVAMSGGVDSSVAVAVLKEQGLEVVGVSLRLSQLVAPEGIDFAQEAAEQMNIPHFVLDRTKEFKREITDFFCQEYLSGRTPNPCVLCNQKIKFGALLDWAREQGADFLASGHYARMVYDDTTDRFLLKKGKDPKKDQSYFLFALSRDQLRSVIFPLGGLMKTEVREKAKKLGLKVFERPESQEICFIHDNNYKKFIKSQTPDLNEKGPIVSTGGEILGEHHGVFSFTIGQRKGLKIAKGYPLYVVSLNKEINTVVVGRKEEVFKTDLVVSRINWISQNALDEPMELKVRVRYQHQDTRARIIPLSEERVRVEFFKPQMAIAPGQAAVFYDDDTVVGGGWIE